MLIWGEMEKKNVVLEKSMEFALEIIEYAETLEEKRKYVVANQLLKSGTSIGANIREAQSAESRQDFIHKIKIAAKEAQETEYWLMLCNRSENYPSNRLISSIISTAKKGGVMC